MFQGLSTSLTALYANRQALETTGNNIANVNTEGYSRQRVVQSEISNNFVSFYGNGSGTGVGVRVEDIQRLRDQFLEARSLAEHSRSGELKRGSDTYSTIEVSFGEPGQSGLQSQLSDYWTSWDKLASNPGDLATRSQVLEQAQTLTSSLQQSSSSLKSLASNSLSLLKADVNNINAMANNIGDLNKAIQSATNSGASPNALLDQRDKLIGQMSELAGVTVQPTSSGSVAVNINGFAIVRDDRVTALQVDDTGSTLQLRWDSDGNPATVSDGTTASVSGGDIGGLMTAITGTVPKYQALLDNVAANLISTVNTVHQGGQDKYGNPGQAFFTGTDAATIGVNTTLSADPNLVAAAKSGGGTLDATNAQKMANLASALNGPDSKYRGMIDVLGTESQRSTRQYEIQTNITNAVDSSRQSVSGVNLDEEMTNMVRYQQAYNASAKYLTVMNETLGSLMNIIQ